MEFIIGLIVGSFIGPITVHIFSEWYSSRNQPSIPEVKTFKVPDVNKILTNTQEMINKTFKP